MNQSKIENNQPTLQQHNAIIGYWYIIEWSRITRWRHCCTALPNGR